MKIAQIPQKITHYVFEGRSDDLTGVSSFHDHGVLHILNQFGRSALQETLWSLRFWLSEEMEKRKGNNLPVLVMAKGFGSGAGDNIFTDHSLWYS